MVGEEALEDGGFTGTGGAGDDDGAVFWDGCVRTVSAWIFREVGRMAGEVEVPVGAIAMRLASVLGPMSFK